MVREYLKLFSGPTPWPLFPSISPPRQEVRGPAGEADVGSRRQKPPQFPFPFKDVRRKSGSTQTSMSPTKSPPRQVERGPAGEAEVGSRRTLLFRSRRLSLKWCRTWTSSAGKNLQEAFSFQSWLALHTVPSAIGDAPVWVSLAKVFKSQQSRLSTTKYCLNQAQSFLANRKMLIFLPLYSLPPHFLPPGRQAFQP